MTNDNIEEKAAPQKKEDPVKVALQQYNLYVSNITEEDIKKQLKLLEYAYNKGI